MRGVGDGIVVNTVNCRPDSVRLWRHVQAQSLLQLWSHVERALRRLSHNCSITTKMRLTVKKPIKRDFVLFTVFARWPVDRTNQRVVALLLPRTRHSVARCAVCTHSDFLYVLKTMQALIYVLFTFFSHQKCVCCALNSVYFDLHRCIHSIFHYYCDCL